jgi:hypothetical protein
LDSWFLLAAGINSQVFLFLFFAIPVVIRSLHLMLFFFLFLGLVGVKYFLCSLLFL